MGVMMASLIGCQQIAGTDFLLEPIMLPLEFEWVEPLEFQHRLMICREADTCSADQLF